MNDAKVSEDDLSDLQRKGMKEVEKSNDYQIKAAREGSNYEFVDYWYSPEEFQKCMWCGNGRCKHMYVIEHEDTDRRLSVGSTCIEKIMGLGNAYDKHENFKEKIDTLAEVKDLNKSELAEEYGDELLTLGKIEEEIQSIREEKERKKQEKLNKQKEMLKEENLLQLKGMNSFVDDVLNQAENGELSDKQVESLKDNRDRLLEDWDSVDEWKEELERQQNVVTGLRLVRSLRRVRKYRRKANESYQEVARDMLGQWKNAYQRPCLSDAQIEYAEDIIEAEKEKVRGLLEEKFGDDKEKLNQVLEKHDIDENWLVKWLDFDEERLEKLNKGVIVGCSNCDREDRISMEAAKTIQSIQERSENSDSLDPMECEKCDDGIMEVGLDE